MVRGSSILLTTTLFLSVTANSNAFAQPQTPAPGQPGAKPSQPATTQGPGAKSEQLPPPRTVLPPQQPSAVSIIDPATGQVTTTTTGLGHGVSVALTVPAGSFDPRAGTWQSPAPPPGAFPLAVRFPTTGVWYYPYPHPPSGQGIVDNRWGVRLR